MRIRPFDEVRDMTADSICMGRDDLDKAQIKRQVASYMGTFVWQAVICITAGVLILVLAVNPDYRSTLLIYGVLAVAVPLIVDLAMWMSERVTRESTVKMSFVRNAVLSTMNPVSVCYFASVLYFIQSCAVYFICAVRF